MRGRRTVAQLCLWVAITAAFAASSAHATIVNVAAMWAQPASRRLSEVGVMLTLLFDLTQLTVLLGLTGGLDGAVAAFADRVQRLERELKDLRGMLEGMGDTQG